MCIDNVIDYCMIYTSLSIPSVILLMQARYKKLLENYGILLVFFLYIKFHYKCTGWPREMVMRRFSCIGG